MEKKLNILWLVFIIGTLLPLLALLPLSFLGYFNQNGGAIAFMIIFSLTPLVLYYYQSHHSIRKNKMPDDAVKTILSITFYVNFLIYMTATLAAFNFIIIGSFLINGEVPMGLDLVPSQIPYLIGGGLYLLIICACGMYYLSKSKTYIRRKIPKI